MVNMHNLVPTLLLRDATARNLVERPTPLERPGKEPSLVARPALAAISERIEH